MTTDSDSNGRENQPRRAGRPSKLTPELKEEILTAIGKGGCTYGGNRRARSRPRGQYSDFSDELKRAEADFRAHHLKKNRCGLLTRQPATDRSPKSLFMLAPPHRGHGTLRGCRCMARCGRLGTGPIRTVHIPPRFIRTWDRSKASRRRRV